MKIRITITAETDELVKAQDFTRRLHDAVQFETGADLPVIDFADPSQKEDLKSADSYIVLKPVRG